ncbi:MAG: hypothetical protein B9S34_09520 [Opitutia bacterium Tous-C1TDCM]|nr:MAG: hypothetical protein B9S34_09520 [Opitutae bacterium Tous-C1TDCM]
MTPAFAALAALLIVAQLVLPWRYAFLPLIIAGCHLGNGEVLGDLTISRFLIMIGLLRAYFAKRLPFTWNHPIDRAFVIFSVIAVLSAAGHRSDISNPWITRIGLVWNIMGAYLYARSYLPNLESFIRYAYALPLILVPLAFGMASEKTTRINAYFLLGASQPYAAEREGKIRAQGPFRHPILAGCAGATTFPFVFLLWRSRRKLLALVGGGACLMIVVACASSGPLAAVAVTVAAAALWRFRAKLYMLRWAALVFGAAYWVVSGRGPWYLMASLDLVGGSTGWHRAKLFDQGWVYLGEWWLYGTDYTRHWMASGVSWSPDHVDVTNYYLHLGVYGGLGLTVMICVILWRCFKALGVRMRQLRAEGSEQDLVLWCVGTALSAHAISFVSISYFDQMYVLFYLVVGAVPGLVVADAKPPAIEPNNAPAT